MAEKGGLGAQGLAACGSLWHGTVAPISSGGLWKISDQICSILPWLLRHESPRAAWAVALLPSLHGCLELLGLAELLLDGVIAVGWLTR